MDIKKRINDVLNVPTAEQIKLLVIDVIKETLDAGHELGGMGEYGNGWNDSRINKHYEIRKIMERWI